MLQQLLMVALVAAAAGYVIWTFLTMSRRQRLLDWLASHGVARGAAARHRARLATPVCSNCAGGAEHGASSDRP
jgi:hypothetical protein